MTTHKSLNMPLSYIELLFRRAYPLCLLYMEGQSLYMPWWSLACCTAHCLLMIFAMSSPCPMLTCVPVFHRILVMHMANHYVWMLFVTLISSPMPIMFEFVTLISVPMPIMFERCMYSLDVHKI